MKKKLRSQKGVAMLMALMTMTVLGILVAELVYQTEVYHRVVFGQVDQLRSRYLAKAGLKLAILQLHAAKKAKEKIKSMGSGAAGAGISNSLGDKIWQTPIILPPPLPQGISEVDKEAVNTLVSSLELNGRIAITISGETQKLNLNSMVWSNAASPSAGGTGGQKSGAPPASGGNLIGSTSSTNPEEILKSNRQTIRDIVDTLLQNKKQEDDDFREKYVNLNADILMGHLLAWMDPNTPLDGENRNKEEYYSRLPNPYAAKNAPLSSMSELHMVRGFDDTLVSLFSDNFTTLLTNGVNINAISAALLRSFIPTLSPNDAEKIVQRKNDPTLGGPFTSADDFWTYANTFGDFKETKNELDKKGIIFTTDDTAYRVIIEASSGYAKKSWVAYIGDPPPEIAEKNPNQQTTTSKPFDISKSLDEQTKQADANKQDATKNDNKVPSIIYLKSE